MGDVASRFQDETRRLDVTPAFVHPGVATDRARGSVRIQPVEHWILEPKPLDRPPCSFLGIRRERHDSGIQVVELRLVLLEVSQLLTAVTSPVTPVEKQHGGLALELVRNPESAAVHRTRLERGETRPDPKSFHGDGYSCFCFAVGGSRPLSRRYMATWL